MTFYPAWYRVKTDRERRGLPGVPPPSDRADAGFGQEAVRSRFALVVEQFDHLPAVMSFLRLLVPVVGDVGSSNSSSKSAEHLADDHEKHPAASSGAAAAQIAFLRLVENTDRTSALLRAAESETALLRADTLAAVLKSFASGLGTNIKAFALSVASPDAYPQQVTEFVEMQDSQVAVVPWMLPAAVSGIERTTDAAGNVIRDESTPGGVAESWLPNPFEGLFTGARSISAHGAAEYATYARQVFAESPSDVIVFLERLQAETVMSGRAHLFLAFHGGSDDRFALSMVEQLVTAHPLLSATVVRITRAAEATEHDREGASDSEDGQVTKATTRESGVTQSDQPLFTLHRHGGANGGDTIYASTHGGNAGRGLQSETEDDVLWSRLTSFAVASDRIEYSSVSSVQPLRYALTRLGQLRKSLNPHNGVSQPKQKTPIFVFAGRGRRDAPSHNAELLALLKERNAALARSVIVSSEVRRALGDMASAYVLDGESGGGGDERILVLQKGGKRGRVPGKSLPIVEEDEAADKPKAA